jgi:hypothetical protein
VKNSKAESKTVNIKLSAAPFNFLKDIVGCYSSNVIFVIKKLGSQQM